MSENQNDPLEEYSSELSTDAGVPTGTPEVPDLDEDLADVLESRSSTADGLEGQFDGDDAPPSGDDSAEALSERAAEDGPGAERELSADPNDDSALRRAYTDDGGDSGTGTDL